VREHGAARAVRSRWSASETDTELPAHLVESERKGELSQSGETADTLAHEPSATLGRDVDEPRNPANSVPVT